MVVKILIRDSKIYKGSPIKGKIIASLGILNIDNRIGRVDNALLSFYALRREEFPEKLRNEFVKIILPKMYQGFLLHEYGNPEKKWNLLYEN